MNLAELLAEVYLITNRSDLSALSTSTVKAATLKAHGIDFFAKDIFETGYKFDSANTSQSLDYINLIANWRSLSYIKRVENATDDKGKFFEIITPAEILDSYGTNRTNIAYVAGRVLEIRSSVAFQFGLLGAYVYPIVTTTGFNSWVAEQRPYAIIYEAASVVFRAIGKIEESNAFRKLLKRDPDRPHDPPGEYDMLLMTSITDVGS